MKLILLLILCLAAIPYSVEIRQAPVSDVLRLLAFIEGKNIIIPGDVAGQVTASFPQISLQDALNSILDSNQLVNELIHDTWAVSTKKTQEALGKDLITKSFNLSYVKAKDFSAQAQAFMVGKGSLIADERSNTVTVHGTQEQLKSLQKFINNTDRPDKQVLIEAKIVNASKKFTQDIGMKWNLSGGLGPVAIGGNVSAPAATSSGAVTSSFSSLGPNNLSLKATLLMGEENNLLTILSKPSIVTMNHQPATISSGLKFFVQTAGNISLSAGTGAGTGTGTGGTNTAAPVNATGTLTEITSGIKLMITPHITPENKISLTINVVLSNPNYSKGVNGIPAIEDNTATTTVLLDDGATTIIGGLAELSEDKKKNGIPVLSRIPILGALFGRTSKEKSNRELLVFITPTVLKEAVKTMPGFSNKNLTKEDE